MSGWGEAIENLFALMELVSETSTIQKFEQDYADCVIRFGDMKTQLAEDTIKFVNPIREKAEAIRQDETYLKKIIAEGAERARESAFKTIEAARKAIGLKYF